MHNRTAKFDYTRLLPPGHHHLSFPILGEIFKVDYDLMDLMIVPFDRLDLDYESKQPLLYWAYINRHASIIKYLSHIPHVKRLVTLSREEFLSLSSLNLSKLKCIDFSPLDFKDPDIIAVLRDVELLDCDFTAEQEKILGLNKKEQNFQIEIKNIPIEMADSLINYFKTGALTQNLKKIPEHIWQNWGDGFFSDIFECDLSGLIMGDGDPNISCKVGSLCCLLRVRDADLDPVVFASLASIVNKDSSSMVFSKKFADFILEIPESALQSVVASAHPDVSAGIVYYSAKANNVQAVKKMLKVGANPNFYHSYYENHTAMDWAIAWQNKEMADELRSQKADLSLVQPFKLKDTSNWHEWIELAFFLHPRKKPTPSFDEDNFWLYKAIVEDRVSITLVLLSDKKAHNWKKIIILALKYKSYAVLNRLICEFPESILNNESTIIFSLLKKQEFHALKDFFEATKTISFRMSNLRYYQLALLLGIKIADLDLIVKLKEKGVSFYEPILSEGEVQFEHSTPILIRLQNLALVYDEKPNCFTRILRLINPNRGQLKIGYSALHFAIDCEQWSTVDLMLKDLPEDFNLMGLLNAALKSPSPDIFLQILDRAPESIEHQLAEIIPDLLRLARLGKWSVVAMVINSIAHKFLSFFDKISGKDWVEFFLFAAEHSKIEILEMLLPGYSLYTYDQFGRTSLTVVAQMKKWDVFNVMLNHMNFIHKEELVYPLHLAVIDDQDEVVRRLMKMGISLDQAESIDLKSDLHNAAKRGDIATIKSLLMMGIDVDQTIEGGLTALHIALQNAQLLTADFLLKKGADVLVRNSDGINAFDLVGSHHFDCLIDKMIRSRLVKYLTELNERIKQMNESHAFRLFTAVSNAVSGYTLEAKKQAAEALLSVLDKCADLASLGEYHDLLKDGRLGEIYQDWAGYQLKEANKLTP